VPASVHEPHLEALRGWSQGKKKERTSAEEKEERERRREEGGLWSVEGLGDFAQDGMAKSKPKQGGKKNLVMVVHDPSGPIASLGPLSDRYLKNEEVTACNVFEQCDEEHEYMRLRELDRMSKRAEMKRNSSRSCVE
jgi:hypothetical protein